MKRKVYAALSFALGFTALLLLLNVATQPPVSAASSTPQGTTRYVAPSGTNEGDCTAQVSPCKTIQYAVDQAQDGDEIAIATTDNMMQAVYTDVSDSVITLDKRDITLQGGYVYGHTTLPPVIKWKTGVIPARVDGEGTRRGAMIQGGSPVLKFLAFINGHAELGGNVYAENAHPKFIGTPILSGTATYGGGMYLKKCSIEFDPGDVNLGVISSQFSGLMLIAHNQAQYGGGLYIEEGTPTLSALAIYSNTASMNGGGAYFNGGHAYLLGGIVQENTAEHNGGGFYLEESAPRIAGTSIVSNTAQAGGGVYLNGPFAFTEANIPIIANNYVRFNHSSTDGGGFYFRQSIAGLVNNIVADNSASNGAAMYLWASSPQVYHNTIAQDKGYTAVYLTEKPGSIWPPVAPLPSQPSFTNTILVSQTIAVYVNSTGFPAPLQNKGSFQGTLWWGNETDTSGSGEVVHTTDVYSTPQFICTGRPPDCLQPYHIMTGSAAMDSGVPINITIPGSDLFVDIDGQLRPSGEGYDIGADEVISETFSVWLLPPVSALGIRPGETVTHTHLLLNSGRETDTYTLTFHTSNGWGQLIASPTITLGAQMSTSVHVFITVPPTATRAMSETDILTATSHQRPHLRAHAVDYTRVLTGTMADLSISKTADRLQVPPGEAIAYTLRITKTGTLTNAVAVTLLDTLVPTRAVAGWQFPDSCSGNEATRRITCTFSLDGEPEIITQDLSLVVTATQPYTGVLVNIATVIGDVRDSNPLNNADSVNVAIRAIACNPQKSVNIAGPREVTMNTVATFTATVHMLTDTILLPPLQPFTYTWKATEQTTQTHVVSATSDTITYTWRVTGEKTISVQAFNPCGTVSSTPYTLTVTSVAEPPYLIYLPLVLRNMPPPGSASD